MEPLTYKSVCSPVWLAKAWWKEAKILVRRIARLPHASARARKQIWDIALVINGIAFVACLILWIDMDTPCNNGCSVKVQDPDKHWTSCGRCHAGVYVCPNERHPHKTECGHCGVIYWDCPSSSQAYNHGISTECKAHNLYQGLPNLGNP